MNRPFGKRFTVLVGNYGSGKTEIAIAVARAMRKEKTGRIALVDLDIVNPYFRSAEQKVLLEAEGIEVYMPSFAMSTVDIPALPAQIRSVFEQDFEHVVIDVGGDDTGATALGCYAPFIKPVREEMSILYVVNPCRPLSSNADDICALYELIIRQARQKVDHLVNNANLQEETDAEVLLEGSKVLKEVSDRLGIPVSMTTGREALFSQLPQEMQDMYFSFEPLMKPDWLVDTE